MKLRSITTYSGSLPVDWV